MQAMYEGGEGRRGGEGMRKAPCPRAALKLMLVTPANSCHHPPAPHPAASTLDELVESSTLNRFWRSWHRCWTSWWSRS